jgi:predicted transcriptional regulator of viral defense system
MAKYFDRALPEIEAEFDAADTRVYRRRDLASLLASKREEWRLRADMYTARFVKEVISRSHLREEIIPFPTYNRFETRYVWRGASSLALAESLGPQAYLCHFTAIYLHGLTNQVPKTIYVNREQSAKPKSKGVLRQERIDAAFSRHQRRSEMIAELGSERIVVLSGKHTGGLAVEQAEHQGPAGAELLRVTSVERTLVDATVRPAYSGGPQVVLDAFRNARDQLSIEFLVKTLARLDYSYPYHQSIGFYLEKSGGYSSADLRLIEEIPREFDFYLDYGMKEPRYDEKWRLFYPRGMELLG